MTRFYVLLPDGGLIFSRKWAYGSQIDHVNHGEAEHCPVCHRAVSPLEWLPPYRINLSKASPASWGDFLWVGGHLMISAHFKEIFQKEMLSGIVEFGSPAEIYRVGTKKLKDLLTPPPVYHLIRVPWGGANQDDIASGTVHEHPEKIKCSFCRVGASWRRQEKVVIEEASWKGTDIFRPRGAPSLTYMVSDKFKEITEASALTNLWLVPSEKYGFDTRRPGTWYVHE